ncbi:DUF192 domain-containing protein [Halegenticoccus tardaugens]|uniref:DUF192 domain-containing protein n=1 Tax=Halegenticoccus tardaugens TaxID=2071624 RepID=UPI00100C1BA2|nr:DUF192 domain-containing protein [Halegenticoccus tardaugens]
MRLVHRHDGTERVLASRVETADSLLAKARGLMFRRSLADDRALVFRFDAPATRSLHMAFVPFPIDALWLVEGEVTRKRRLRAWADLAWGTADAIVELPAGAADGVREGDVVELRE